MRLYSVALRWAYLLSLVLSLAWGEALRPRTVSSFQNVTSSSTTVAPPVTSYQCCALFAGPVFLATWYNSTIELVVATVITQYLQYNNTVITTSTTKYNKSATSIYGTYTMDGGPGFTYPGLPTDILGDAGDAVYQATIVEPIGAVSGPNGPISSPTQFMILQNASALYQVTTTSLYTEIETNTSCGNPTCYSTSAWTTITDTGFDNGISCETAITSYVSSGTTGYDTVIPTSTIDYSGGDPFIQGEEGDGSDDNGVVNFDVPGGWIYTFPVNESVNYHTLGGDEFLPFPEALVTYLAGIPENVKKFPQFTKCFRGGVSGQPSVHIPVAELTASSSTTTYIGGNFGQVNSSPLPKPKSTPKSAPASATPVPAPSATKSGGESPSPNSPSPNKPESSNTPNIGGIIPSILASTPPPVTKPSSAAQQPGQPSQSPQPGQASQGSPGGNGGSPASAAPSAKSWASPGVPTVVPVGSSSITITPLSSGGVVIPGGKTLTPGTVAVIQGATVSVAPSGTALVLGSTTVPLPGYVSPSGAAVTASIGGSAVQFSVALSSAGVVLPNGQTLAPGFTTSVNGAVISLAPSGSALVVGSSTIALPAPAPSTAGVVLTVNGKPATFSYASSSAAVILPNGQTLAPGSTTSVNGAVVSLAPSGSALVVGGTTVPLSSAASTNAAVVVTINGKPATFSYASSSAGIILPNGQTLAPGSATSISGAELSLGPSESYLVVGTSTVLLTPAETTGIGSYIISGLGGSSSYTGPMATGGANSANDGFGIRSCGVIGAIIILEIIF